MWGITNCEQIDCCSPSSEYGNSEIEQKYFISRAKKWHTIVCLTIYKRNIQTWHMFMLKKKNQLEIDSLWCQNVHICKNCFEFVLILHTDIVAENNSREWKKRDTKPKGRIYLNENEQHWFNFDICPNFQYDLYILKFIVFIIYQRGRE